MGKKHKTLLVEGGVGLKSHELFFVYWLTYLITEQNIPPPRHHIMGWCDEATL